MPSFCMVFNAVLNCNMVGIGTWCGHEDGCLRGRGLGKLSRSRCSVRSLDVRMCDKTAANRDVVIHELQTTASYMVDATQQAKFKRYVGSRRNARRDWNGAMYVGGLRGRSAIVMARIRRGRCGRGRKFREG